MDNYLVPYLSMGGTREQFFKLTPKTIKYDFKAYEMRQQDKLQTAWLTGYYVKMALASTVLVAGLADKKIINKMPEYPEMPKPKTENQKKQNDKLETELLIAKMDKLMNHINNSNIEKRRTKPNE